MEGTPPMSSYEDETGVKLIIIIIIIIIDIAHVKSIQQRVVMAKITDKKQQN